MVRSLERRGNRRDGVRDASSGSRYLSPRIRSATEQDATIPGMRPILVVIVVGDACTRLLRHAERNIARHAVTRAELREHALLGDPVDDGAQKETAPL